MAFNPDSVSISGDTFSHFMLMSVSALDIMAFVAWQTSMRENVLTGSGVQVVDFGSVADAKAIFVEVASDAAAPINLRFNGGTDDHEVAAGGFYAASNPVPATGVSALSIVYTADAKVTVRILG